jgi:hypothetical protein
MKIRIWLLFPALIISLFIEAPAYAFSSFLIQFNARYGTIGSALDTCLLCHRSQEGGSRLNPYGKAFKESGYNFEAIEPKDSDGDSFTNLDEINARTFPGNLKSAVK